MIRLAYCPSCNDEQWHRSVTDEFGEVLWCERCSRAHLPAKPEAECGQCGCWHLSMCLHQVAAVMDTHGDCAYRRPRRHERC